MILTKDNFVVEEYFAMSQKKIRKFFRLVILCKSHKLHNDNFLEIKAALAHRAAILGQTVNPVIVEDGSYHRVTSLNNFVFHSEKLNLFNAIKLYDELK